MIDLLKYNNDIISLNEDIKRHINELGSGKIEDVSKVKKKKRRGKRGGRRVRENDERKKGLMFSVYDAFLKTLEFSDSFH